MFWIGHEIEKWAQTFCAMKLNKSKLDSDSESLSLQKYQNLHNEVKIMCFDPKRFVQRLYETFIPAWGSLSGR